MTHPVPDITLDVDLRNPGQFFACCGVLELASRMWPGSEGWFVRDGAGATFHVTTGRGTNEPLADIARLLCADKPLVTIAEDDGIGDIQADRQAVALLEPFNIRLDWWQDAYGDGDKSELKVWAGQQTPARNLPALQDIWRKINAAQPNEIGLRTLFSQRWPETGMGFDPSSSWKAIDVGFSPDEQQVNVLTSPAVEILTAIGLQRCRPERLGEKGRYFIYRAWADPVEIMVAPTAVTGGVRSLSAHMFPVNMRNSQYGNFGWAKPWEDKQ
jgi:hypothetical protein